MHHPKDECESSNPCHIYTGLRQLRGAGTIRLPLFYYLGIMKITGQQLKDIAGAITLERANDLAAISNHCDTLYGPLSVRAMEAFLPNLIHESGNFRIKKENLNYTTPERLVAVWPSRFNLTGTGGKKKAADYVKQPDKLANLVYGGRMGNTDAGDGSKFVGGGFAQLTGRGTYEAYFAFLKGCDHDAQLSTVEELANLVQTNDTWAMDSAFWFFCKFKPGLLATAEMGNITQVRKLWNGGHIGLNQVTELYERAKQVLS